MGLYKRDSVWWIDIRYQGKRIRKSCETSDRRLAQAIFGKLTAQIIEGKFFDKLEESERTFGEMMDRYMTEHSITKAPMTHRRNRQFLLHLLPFFEPKTKCLAEVSPSLLAQYKTLRRKEGAAPATINKELGMVRHAFNLARREWEWCRENPMEKVSMEVCHNQIDRWLTVEEEKRLMASARPWLQAIIIFALNTGMRRGEILALRWRDVDLSRGILTVMKSKNYERRTLPLNSSVFSLLIEKDGALDAPGDLVFKTSNKTHITLRNLSRAFQKTRDRAGIPGFRFHDLRHTFATRLVQKGVDLYKVQRLLGHKSPTTTQRYAHHCPESLRDGVRVLDVPPSPEWSQFGHNPKSDSQGMIVNY